MISNKAMTALQLIEGTERKKFLKLQNDKIIRADNNLMAVWMYVQLQNPLLERYRVDVPEIIKGATYAFDCAYRAISSKDLSDYAVGERDSSVSNDLLKDTMNTTLYTAFLNASKDLRAQGIDSNLTDLRINSVTLTNIHTEIVPGDVEEGTEYMSDREREGCIERKRKMKWLKNFTESTSSSSSIDTKKSTETEKTTTKVVRSEKEAQSVSSAAAASPSTTTTTTTTTAVASPTAAPTVPTVSPPAAVASAPSAHVSGEESQVYRAQPATRAALRSARANSSTRSNTVAPASPTVPITPTETAATSTTATTAVKDRHTESSSESPAPAHTEEESTAAAEPAQPTEKELSAYPPGSVLASVEVRFDIQEEFETKLHSSKKKQTSATTDTTTTTTTTTTEEKEDDAALVDMLSTVKNARKTSVHWTFRGCISGQVPLSWTVVAFNGMGSRNSKY